MPCSYSHQSTTLSNQTDISQYENSSVTSTATNYKIQTTYYTSENASVLKGERELTTSNLNIGKTDTGVYTTTISPSSEKQGLDSMATLLWIMVTIAFIFGMGMCLFLTISKIRKCRKKKFEGQRNDGTDI